MCYQGMRICDGLLDTRQNGQRRASFWFLGSQAGLIFVTIKKLENKIPTLILYCRCPICCSRFQPSSKSDDHCQRRCEWRRIYLTTCCQEILLQGLQIGIPGTVPVTRRSYSYCIQNGTSLADKLQITNRTITYSHSTGRRNEHILVKRGILNSKFRAETRSSHLFVSMHEAFPLVVS